MFNILPLILILICLGVAAVIVVRKFSILANLDVDSIPAEREAKVREQIISNRLKRNFFKFYKKAGKVAVPAAQGIASLSKGAYEKLLEYKEKRRQEEELMVRSEEDVVEKRFYEIEELMKADNWPEAEKKCIEVIGLDATNIRAFQLLGKVYTEKKEYQEATQTLEHSLRLLEKDFRTDGEAGENQAGLNIKIAQIYYDLANISRLAGNHEAVFKYIEPALAIEPNNPKMLDIKLQTSIIIKDKDKALSALAKLREANPENQKLAEYEEQSRAL